MISILIIILLITLLLFINIQEDFVTAPKCGTGTALWKDKNYCVKCEYSGGTLKTDASKNVIISTGVYNYFPDKKKIELDKNITNYPICTYTCPPNVKGLENIGKLSYNESDNIMHFCSTSGFLCPNGYKVSGTTCIIDTAKISCGDKYKYDSVKNICKPISCPSGYKLVNDNCETICENGLTSINNVCQQTTCPNNTIMKKDISGNSYCEYIVANTENYDYILNTNDTNKTSIIHKCKINQIISKDSSGNITCKDISCPKKGDYETILKKNNEKYYCFYNSCAVDETLNTTTNKCDKKCKLNYNYIPNKDGTYSCKPELCPNNFISVPESTTSNYYKCIPTCPKSNIGNLTLSGNLCVIDTTTPIICANNYNYDDKTKTCVTSADFSIQKTSPNLIRDKAF